MKRVLKVALIVLFVGISLGFAVKQENFLQVHYDTIEERSLERTSFLGIPLEEKVKWSKGGYRQQYQEIYGAEPLADRWRSWPIRTVWLGTDRWRSPVTPRSLSLRKRVVRGIFTRYDQDHSAEAAKDSFSALEAILPGSDLIEDFGPDRVRSKEELIKESPVLQNLDYGARDSNAQE